MSSKSTQIPGVPGHGKLGYKTFEYIADLQREVFRLRTVEAQRALDQAQNARGWPWCLTQEQIEDWNTLWAQLDPPTQGQRDAEKSEANDGPKLR